MLAIPRKSKPRDRNLSDLTPTLAEYILWHAIGHVQSGDHSFDESDDVRTLLTGLIAEVNPR